MDLRAPRLTLKLASGAPKESTARRDDVDLGSSAFDTAFPVDIGNHAIVVTAPGRQEGRFTVELGEGESKTLEVAPGEPVPAVKAAPPAPVAAPPPTVAPGETGTKHGSQTTIALIAGGAGVVSVVAGAVLGARAGSSWSSAQRDCTPNDCGAGSNAQREKSDADTAATLSTITVAAGAALIAGAAVLYFLPSGTKASAANASRPRLVPVAGVRGGGLFFTGAF